MLIDVNECPLCGGRKSDTDFCEDCIQEMDAAPDWLGSARRAITAATIMCRNGRLATYFERGKRSAAARLKDPLEQK